MGLHEDLQKFVDHLDIMIAIKFRLSNSGLRFFRDALQKMIDDDKTKSASAGTDNGHV